MFRLYLASHFNIAFELLGILIIYGHFSSDGYILETFSVYLFVIGLFYTPVVFNPNGLDFTYARYTYTSTYEVFVFRALPVNDAGIVGYRELP